jgi:hypothetical protein
MLAQRQTTPHTNRLDTVSSCQYWEYFAPSDKEPGRRTTQDGKGHVVPTVESAAPIPNTLSMGTLSGQMGPDYWQNNRVAQTAYSNDPWTRRISISPPPTDGVPTGQYSFRSGAGQKYGPPPVHVTDFSLKSNPRPQSTSQAQSPFYLHTGSDKDVGDRTDLASPASTATALDVENVQSSGIRRKAFQSTSGNSLPETFSPTDPSTWGPNLVYYNLYLSDEEPKVGGENSVYQPPS